MNNTTHGGTEKHHESTKPESSKTVKHVFLLLSFSDGLAQYCVNLLSSLHTKQQHFIHFCMTVLLFHNLKVSPDSRSHSLKNYGFHFGMIFVHMCT